MTHQFFTPPGLIRMIRLGFVLAGGLLLSHTALAEDTRQRATLPPAAQESLRQEMLDNLLAINEILTLMAADKIKEAGEVAEQKLGISAQGKIAVCLSKPVPDRTCHPTCMRWVWMATKPRPNLPRRQAPASAAVHWRCCPI